MGQPSLLLGQLSGPDTIVVTVRRVAVTTHAALRTCSVPPERTLEHQGPRWAQSLCDSWPKSLDRFEPVDGESGA